MTTKSRQSNELSQTPQSCRNMMEPVICINSYSTRKRGQVVCACWLLLSYSSPNLTFLKFLSLQRQKSVSWQLLMKMRWKILHDFSTDPFSFSLSMLGSIILVWLFFMHTPVPVYSVRWSMHFWCVQTFSHENSTPDVARWSLLLKPKIDCRKIHCAPYCP